MKRIISWAVLTFGLALVAHTLPAAIAGESSPGGAEAAVALYKEGKAGEAVAAFDRLLAEKPGDPGLRIWKAHAVLEQARMMRAAKDPAYEKLVLSAYASLKRLTSGSYDDPDWCLAMAKAFWLNGRPQKARKAIEKALYYRKDFPEALMLRADVSFDECLNMPGPSYAANPGGVPLECAGDVLKEYEAVLRAAGLSRDLQSEACCKMGDAEWTIKGKNRAALGWWEKAASAGPESRYGKMGRESLERNR